MYVKGIQEGYNMNVTTVMAREKSKFNRMFGEIKELHMCNNSMELEPMDIVNNKWEAIMMKTKEGTKFMVEFGMGQREVGQERRFLEGGGVFLPGLEMGMVIPHRRDGTGGVQARFLMALSKGVLTSFQLVFKIWWEGGFQPLQASVTERESGWIQWLKIVTK